MLMLPYPPRRSHLLGFWVGLYALLLLLLFFISIFAGGLWGPGLSLLGITAIFAIGLVWRPVSIVGYRMWNAAASRVARFGSLYVGALLHFLVFPLMGVRHPEFSSSDPGNTMWYEYRRSSLSQDASAPKHTGWIREFIDSGEGPERNLWLPVFPMLMILSVFEARRSMPKDLPENNYTLF